MEIVGGSRAFFEGIPGFIPGDTDKVIFRKQNDILVHRKIGKISEFIWKEDSTKEEIIDYFKVHAGIDNIGYFCFSVFLIPECADHWKVTVEDLKNLKSYIESFDEKHRYLVMICNFYIENNDFGLTEEQRIEAFEDYKKKRNQ